jgi:3-oxoadipate enol-lactonase
VPSVDLGGVRLHYELSGCGPVLVLLNGIFQRQEAWDPLLARIPGWRLLRYDMRGQGRSEAPPGAYNPALHAQDLQGLLAATRVERFALLGLSNGGVVAQHFASTRPPGLEGLVLACTTPRLDPLLRAKVESWAAALEAGGTTLRIKVAAPWAWGQRFTAGNPQALGPEALAAAAELAPTEAAQKALLEGFLTLDDLRPALARVEAPTLVLSGEDDLLFPPAYGREIAAAIPGARFEVHPSVGHVAPLEDPAGFTGRVNAFLAGLTEGVRG